MNNIDCTICTSKATVYMNNKPYCSGHGLKEQRKIKKKRKYV